MSMTANNMQSAGVIPFLREFKLRILLLSVVLLIPCFWHRRIEAGDLSSHVYNAWLAQLIEKGQAPGLYVSNQWNNVLFDIALLRVANLAGIPAAEKIVVSICVLVFFWGVFAFVRTIAERPAWFLTPCIAMLAYGYSFSMGFMNYYLSLGLACFGLAILWRARQFEWIAAVPFALLAMVAHPIGFLWMIGTWAYIKVSAKLPGWWKLALPLAASSGFAAVYWYTSHRPSLFADWDRGPFYLYNGADQLGLYGKRYFFLAGAAFFFGLICVAVEFYARRRDGSSWKLFELPFELYLVTFCATALLPENLRPSLLPWVPEAAEMASRRLRRLRRRFLCVSLSRHGLAQPAGSKRRKVGKRSAPGDARHHYHLGSSRVADQFYRPRGRARLHRALLQLCEL